MAQGFTRLEVQVTDSSNPNKVMENIIVKLSVWEEFYVKMGVSKRGRKIECWPDKKQDPWV